MNERFRVQFYTERHDGTHEYCVCDFGDQVKRHQRPEFRNAWSPIIRDAFGRNRETTTDRAEAERIAQALNAGLLSVCLMDDRDDYGRKVTIPYLEREALNAIAK